jgi:hypothetical protein
MATSGVSSVVVVKTSLRHVPDRGDYLVRYYGWYSDRARGMRNAEDGRR